jgi:hypothetical protein
MYTVTLAIYVAEFILIEKMWIIPPRYLYENQPALP